jgi:1,4-dihydroxy-2-naphthoate octaprenyltransferase
MSDLKFFFGPMRLPFLILTPVSVLLGFGTAVSSSKQISITYFILTLIGALSAHISVDAFNEYFDFKSGLDFKTERTPFSGGSGTLPSQPGLARRAMYMALGALAVTGLIGLYFIYARGVLILPLGLLGLITVVAYTPWLAYHPIFCLLAPGLGFGLLMVMGTNFVLTGEYSWTVFTVSLVPFFLVNNLLLLNQFPDVEADNSVGRKNLPIIIGRRASSLVYGLFFLFAYLSILLGVYFGYLPRTCLMGLATLLIALPVSVGAYRHAENIKRLIPYMGLNVLITIMTPVLVAIGLFVT